MNACPVAVGAVQHGTWPSLVGHLTGGQGVAGSNPAVPTGFSNSCTTSTAAKYSSATGQAFCSLGWKAVGVHASPGADRGSNEGTRLAPPGQAGSSTALSEDRS